MGPSLFRVATSEGDLLAERAGKLRFGDRESITVGDWVHVAPHGDGRAVIHGRFRRGATLSRRSAGASATQVIAANVDTVFVVTSANRDLNPRRLERYLIAAWDGGAQPVVVVNKIDLCDDPESLIASLSDVTAGVPLHLVSALDAQGLAALESYTGPAQTVALIGSSGVGKSTLVNRLLGHDAQTTLPQREDDDRGRHTTTARDLLRLPKGGALIDTPGMRELGLLATGDGAAQAFPKIQALAHSCRFRNCAHASEPGCAVQQATSSGKLSSDRLSSWQKLTREQARAARKADGLARSLERKSRRRKARAFRRRDRRD
jgi:ribosome biogenesis GTPase